MTEPPDYRGYSVLVTGGAGFIGSALCRHLVRAGARVTNLDKLTYAANPASLAAVANQPNYRFVRADIADAAAVAAVLAGEAVDIVMHLAAETHVDRSIEGPLVFVDTNVMGTCRLLETSLAYWRGLPAERRARFRFHHISTDEVFGDLPFEGDGFSEDSAYAPSSPYAASKAAADHFVRAWHRTYGLPVLLSNCSNNYGPFHFPEKLIPLTILNALEGLPLRVYGTGNNIRDWLHVDDHARALGLIATAGVVGRSYGVGGGAERSNIAVVQAICGLLDQRRPRPDGRPHAAAIQFVDDRPGHDRRYAMNTTRIGSELGWRPELAFEPGLAATVDWYLDNEWWWRPLREGRYAGERLGLVGR